jgi:SGNH domain (fused to AT3 domains)
LIAALSRNSHVVYVRELPTFKSSPTCFLRRVKVPWQQCSPHIARSAVEGAQATYDRIVNELSEEMPSFEVINPIDTLCSASVCSQKLRSGEVIYSDQLHLSPAGGRYLARTSGLPGLVASGVVVGP